MPRRADHAQRFDSSAVRRSETRVIGSPWTRIVSAHQVRASTGSRTPGESFQSIWKSITAFTSPGGCPNPWDTPATPTDSPCTSQRSRSNASPHRGRHPATYCASTNSIIFDLVAGRPPLSARLTRTLGYLTPALPRRGHPAQEQLSARPLTGALRRAFEELLVYRGVVSLPASGVDLAPWFVNQAFVSKIRVQIPVIAV